MRTTVRSALTAAAAVLLVGCAGRSSGTVVLPSPPGARVGDSTARAAVARERAGAGGADARTLGVLPFVGSPTDTALAPLAYALADLLTTDLARSAQLTLVERSRLTDVLRELDLVRRGVVDTAMAPRVGRLVQARRLVVGSLGTLGTSRGTSRGPAGAAGTIRLGVRLADVRTGEVAQTVDASASLNDVLAAEKALAFRLFDALGVTLTPAERAAVEQRPTTNLAALLAYGRGVRAEYEGDYRSAWDEFRRARSLDAGFGAASARAVQARTAFETGPTAPILVPGIRPVDAAVATTVDRLNRPLDPISTLTRPSTAADPSFPMTTTTVVIVVTRP